MGHKRDSTCGRRRFAPRPAPFLVASAAEAGPIAGVLSMAREFQLSLVSGAAAGFTVDAVLFPLDTLKTRLQMAGASQVARRDLLKGIYHGFGPAVVASAPAAAAFFGMYDYVKRVLVERDTSGKYTPLCHMAAAAAGDVASSTVRVPFEVVKQRLQSGMYKTSVEAIRATFAKEGMRGFFAGYGSLVLRELPFDAIQFPLYEFLKTSWAKRSGTKELETWQNSVCGSIAGGISAAVTTPLDVVKTRLMTQAPGGVRYKGIVDGLQRVAREEGGAALLSGIVPRVVWISLGGAVFFGAYEATKTNLFPHFAKADKLSSERTS